MSDTRARFHDELQTLEQEVLDIADRAEREVALAVEALVDNDLARCDQVVAMDEELDRVYLDAHNHWINIVARQGPMGADLRLLSSLLHLLITLERMGDQAVNIVTITRATHDLPRSDKIVGQIREMGDLVLPMIRSAMQSFVRRDPDEARLLPAMDEPIDQLNRNMYRTVVECADDPLQLEWATRMMMVSRALERVGDQAVDVGEQVAFLTTGELQEFVEEGIASRHGDR
jgi:phosphate transport system protein